MSTILIADDVKDMRDLLWAILSSSGHKVLQASSGIEVVEQLEKNSEIELILLDVNMPEMTGIEAVQKIKTIRPDKNLKICFVSGSRDKQTVLKALASGGQDYIVKPIDPAILLEKISKILGGKLDAGFATLKLRAKATLQGVPMPVDFWITELSEVHLTFESPLPFEKGGLMDVVSESINKHLGGDYVFSCRAMGVDKKNDSYFVNCSFVGVHENMRKQIRSLVVRNTKIMDGPSKTA